MNRCATRHRDPSPLPAERIDRAGQKAALADAKQCLDATPLPPLDAVIHGVGVRLHTNNPHWRRFWSANWFAPKQWLALTAAPSPIEPTVHLYAVAPDAEAMPWAGYHREQNVAFLIGDTPYGPLRALALGAVARLLAEDEAVHFVPGVCLTLTGQGTLLLHPPDSDLMTIIGALEEQGDSHLVAPAGVFVRYGLVRMVDGVTLLPTALIDEKGLAVPGYRLFPWLDEYGYWEPRADARCLTLQGEAEFCFARDLDLGRVPEAFAFPTEKAWYLPTQVVVPQPSLVGALWLRGEPDDCGGLENVPPFSRQLLAQFGGWASQAVASLASSATPALHSLFDQIGNKGVMEALCCLRAAPEARAMVSPEQLWAGRAGGHPWRPIRIKQVMLIDGEGFTRLDAEAVTAQLTRLGATPATLYEEEIARVLAEMLGRATQ